MRLPWISNFFLSFYHFLGGVHFALLLIAITAAWTAWGTYVESKSGSHLLAMDSIYNSYFFLALLYGFFLNILISALRRWPYKIRHLPFLITHCGLLMILSGVIIKNIYGLQAIMPLTAGSQSDLLFLPYTYALEIDTGTSNKNYPFTLSMPPQKIKEGKRFSKDPLVSLEIALLSYSPHGTKEMESFVATDAKGRSFLRLKEAAPLPFSLFNGKNDEALPAARIKRFSNNNNKTYAIYALETDDLAAAAEKLFLNLATVVIRKKKSGKLLLKKALIDFINEENSPLDNLSFSPSLKIAALEEKTASEILWDISLKEPPFQATMALPLEGREALRNKWAKSVPYSAMNITIDIECPPAAAWLYQKRTGELQLVSISSSGEIHREPLFNNKPSSIFSYDRGRRGYGIQISLPASLSFNTTREELGQAMIFSLGEAVRQGVEKERLAPPLRLLQLACEKAHLDFIAVFTEWVDCWEKSSLWMFSPPKKSISSALYTALNRIDWTVLPKDELNSLLWMETLVDGVQKGLNNNLLIDELPLIKTWPMPLPHGSIELLLETVCRQLLSTKESLPALPSSPISEPLSAKLFSLYCQIEHLSPSSLLIAPSTAMEKEQLLVAYRKKEGNLPALEAIETIEAPLTYRYEAAPPQEKTEDNRPLVRVRMKEKEGRSEEITLQYEPFVSGLKWPIFNGKYLLRFQPRTAKLPWQVRLHDAKQINYAGTDQPFSFESALSLTNKNTKETTFATLSMNHVHETADGYRFYLSSIAPKDESSLQYVQLAVNYDPVRNVLTYPGALLLSFGIALFLWQQLRKNDK